MRLRPSPRRWCVNSINKSDLEFREELRQTSASRGTWYDNVTGLPVVEAQLLSEGVLKVVRKPLSLGRFNTEIRVIRNTPVYGSLAIELTNIPSDRITESDRVQPPPPIEGMVNELSIKQLYTVARTLKEAFWDTMPPLPGSTPHTFPS